MTTSVIIIAHNEERYIGKCIESLLDQTQKPDEIVLIAHNSTDKTVEIANRYPITVFPYTSGKSATDARIEGLKHISGDMVFCIDGDSWAAKNWIEEMSATLLHSGNVLVGSWVRFYGTFFNRLSNTWNKYCCKRKGIDAVRWIWGASMAFWGKDTEVVKDIFEKTFQLSRELELTRNVDDLWLVLFMSKRGGIECTNRTWVATMAAETSSRAAIGRNRENLENGHKMEEYFKGLK